MNFSSNRDLFELHCRVYAVLLFIVFVNEDNSWSFVFLSGSYSELQTTISNVPFGISCGLDPEVGDFSLQTQYKKRRISRKNNDESYEFLREIEYLLPTLSLEDYYVKPSLTDLAARELRDPGYCSRVPGFTVGRLGFGCVKFLGTTDVRWLDVNKIVKFRRHEIVVYEDDSDKPEAGQGLNKAAEVTLILQVRLRDLNKRRIHSVVKKLKENSEQQGATFNSFNPENGEWKFLVSHFSRFGLSDDDEEDITMDDVAAVEEPVEMINGETSDANKATRAEFDPTGPMLYHSLPTHLGLDPVKMKEMRMLMFPVEEEEEEEEEEVGNLSSQ